MCWRVILNSQPGTHLKSLVENENAQVLNGSKGGSNLGSLDSDPGEIKGKGSHHSDSNLSGVWQESGLTHLIQVIIGAWKYDMREIQWEDCSNTLKCGLKTGYIDLKYYADATHLAITRRVNNSWPAGLTKAEVSPIVCTPLSPSVCTPHQILYSPALTLRK